MGMMYDAPTTGNKKSMLSLAAEEEGVVPFGRGGGRSIYTI
jgi:hypothetical protein